MKAVILCAGKGERMMPLTESCPKCLLPYKGKPILSYTLDNLHLHKNEIEPFFVVGYLGSHVVNFLQEYNVDLNHIIFQEDNLSTDTAGLLSAKSVIESEQFFMVMNSDIIITKKDFDAVVLAGLLNKQVIFVKEYQLPYGVLFPDCRGYDVKAIIEKPMMYINAGIYIFSNEILKFLSKDKCILEGVQNMIDNLQLRRKKGLGRRKSQIIIFPLDGEWKHFSEPKDLDD